MGNSIAEEIQKLYCNQLEPFEVIETQNALVDFIDLLIEIDREIGSKKEGENNENT